MSGKNGTKPKVLHVDDNLLQQTVISLLLTQYGFDVQSAGNGREGVDLALEWLPDLILMDVMMPVMDGAQATEILQADPRTSNIPILALTAMSNGEILTRVKAAGVSEILPKTLSPLLVVQKIITYLAE